MYTIGHIHTDFPEKFGVPRQSGRISSLTGYIDFLPEYRQLQAFRGIEEFSHLWLIWEFHLSDKSNWSATVKPPRLGGNTRMGVFATRSPYRPNNIGLSSVRLEAFIPNSETGPRLLISGVDMVDGTPLYDIKPYIPYSDCHPDATGGFIERIDDAPLEVCFPEEMLHIFPHAKRSAVISVLAEDPRPGYQHDPGRVYGIYFAGYNVRFTVSDRMLTVVSVEPMEDSKV